jgi:hypothetical protein
MTSARCYAFAVVTAPVRLSSLGACSAILLWLALPAVAAPSRKVSIDTEPSGAIVYVGEKEAGPKGVTPVMLELPVGDNVVIIELENFVPKFETLTVPRGKGKPIKVIYKLERGNGALVVVTDAAGKGAKVMIDDEERGTAPARIDVPSGSHRVEVIVKGKTIYSDVVDVGAGGETNVIAKAAGKLGKDAGKDPRSPPPRERLPVSADPVAPADPAEPAEPRQADPPAISTREDDPEPVLEEKARGEPGRDQPSGPRRWRIAPLVESGYRYVDYSAINSGSNLPALRQRGTVLFGARVEYQPLRSLAGLMIAADGGYGIPQTLTTSRGSAQSVWWRGEAEVSYRLGLGSRWGVFALVGYGRQRYKFDGAGGAEALVPAATYNLIRIGAGAGYRQGSLELTAQVENRPVLTGGTFADRFRTASADGLATSLSALVHLGSRFFVRVDGNYARYAWSFGYGQDDLYRAGGATDLMFGVTFATGAAF